MTMPSFTKNVSGWQLTFTHPVRSLPLNIGTKPASLSSARAGVRLSRNTKKLITFFMAAPIENVPCLPLAAQFVAELGGWDAQIGATNATMQRIGHAWRRNILIAYRGKTYGRSNCLAVQSPFVARSCYPRPYSRRQQRIDSWLTRVGGTKLLAVAQVGMNHLSHASLFFLHSFEFKFRALFMFDDQ